MYQAKMDADLKSAEEQGGSGAEDAEEEEELSSLRGRRRGRRLKVRAFFFSFLKINCNVLMFVVTFSCYNMSIAMC